MKKEEYDEKFQLFEVTDLSLKEVMAQSQALLGKGKSSTAPEGQDSEEKRGGALRKRSKASSSKNAEEEGPPVTKVVKMK